MGQMAVRIALQCSESDAHLILSEDNTAARLLSRPGEAIYNDANGLFEGNHPFQTVWLSDDRRENYLQKIAEIRDATNSELPIVFEGNVPADPQDSPAVRQLFETFGCGKTTLTPTVYLGAPVSIKDPTSMTFQRHSGNNLLIVGQDEEMAIGILANCLICLLSQYREAFQSSSADANTAAEASTLRRFYILDGTRPESPVAGIWQRLARQLSIDAQLVQPREASAAIDVIAREVDQRVESGSESDDPIFLSVVNLSRFRDLQRSDDFGFSSLDGDAPANAGKQLTNILREGPNVGVHSLVWCDSFNNVNRWLDRQTLRDLEMRVLFQMSGTDSSNLMDSPAASRLGVHRAILYSEEQGQFEKFRPYCLPTNEWLKWVNATMERSTSSHFKTD
jgi:hypothetical protein